MNTAAKLRTLENALSVIAGAPVEITIRDARAFTWSLADMDEAAAARLVDFAKRDPRCKVEAHHDAEAGSFVYVDAAS